MAYTCPSAGSPIVKHWDDVCAEVLRWSERNWVRTFSGQNDLGPSLPDSRDLSGEPSAREVWPIATEAEPGQPQPFIHTD